MTRKTFYKKLSKWASSFKWSVNEIGEIRGFSKDKKIKEKFCPLTAVYYKETGNVVDISQYDKLNVKGSCLISISADNDIEGLPIMDRPIRRALLRRLGLKT